MARITFENLAEIRKHNNDKKIVFCSGGFDLTHAGHVLFLEDCKKEGDILIVMVGGDSPVKRDKGANRPILNEHARLKLIDSLKPVDYCFIDNFVSPGAHPLSYIDQVIRELKPDAYVINEDAKDIPYRKALAERHGVKLVISARACPPEFENISTSKIIKKIKELP